MKYDYTVEGMTCSACSARVEKCVKKIEGVESASVNLLTGALCVTAETDLTAEISKAVTAEGYKVKIGFDRARGSGRQNALKKRLIISLPLVAFLMYIAMGSMIGIPVPWFLDAMNMKGAVYGLAAQAVVAAAIIAVNFEYYSKGFKNLFTLKPNMDSLVALGSSASFLYGVFSAAVIVKGSVTGDHALMERYMKNLYFEGSAMIVALITLGKFLEEKSKNKTTSAIGKLLELAPDKAIIEINGEEKEIPSQDIKKGDTVILKDGARVPCDGSVIFGDGYADESAITGESMPVYKKIGDKVVGGTSFSGGYIKFAAENVGEDSAVYKIVRLVEDANSTKVPIAKIADKVSGVFVPVVTGVALLAFACWMIAGYGVSFAINVAVSVLVVSCPCALGLATPVALMVGTGKAAERGILFKSGEALQKLSTVDTVLLDKTGTLTANEPKVTKAVAFSGDENAMIFYAASAETGSSHPLAKPVIGLAENRGISLAMAQDYAAEAGRGISATINGEKVAVGNYAFIADNVDANDENLKFAMAAKEENPTVVFVAVGGKLAGYAVVEDVLSENAKRAVKAFKGKGMRVIMLTGDNERAAKKVADELGIEYRAEVLPEDKYAEVVKYTSGGRKTLMIGDGVNDAPALTAAYVGMAIGAGTDVAIESADAVLIKNDLSDAVEAVNLGKKTMRNVKENLFWAFVYNIILIPVACGALYIPFGILMNPVYASAAMSLSSVSVVLNALRLNLSKKERKSMKKGKITVVIDGMSCEHCKKRVEQALSALGAAANVELKKKRAIIDGDLLTDEQIVGAITDAGYSVKKIERD